MARVDSIPSIVRVRETFLAKAGTMERELDKIFRD